jgi:Ca-activated chloride channel family protein
MFRKRFSQDHEIPDELDAMVAAARNEAAAPERAEQAQHRLVEKIRAQRASTAPANGIIAVPPWQIARGARRARRRYVGLSLSAAVLTILVLLPIFFSNSGTTPALAGNVIGGQLRIIGPDGSMTNDLCPLKHTDVEANITGFMSRTIVRQQFTNPRPNKIEADYVFPLPPDAAVDSMTMTVGNRRIVGMIKPREEARATYNAARQAGHTAALLDQERPNIFTQSVANIEPGAKVEIEISYVETLRGEDGTYTFSFPMTVAPRYIPGDATTATEPARLNLENTRVPDAARISPPVAPRNRAGHDVSVTVYLEAGTQIFDLRSEVHTIDIEKDGPTRAIVSLHDQKEIPNRDFTLKYRLASERISDAFLTSSGPRGSFFTLMLQPPRSVAPTEAVPKEMIFVIDRSGSMSGRPIEKAKETMRLCIEQMNPRDSFNLLSFSGGTGKCFDKPVENTPDNRAAAQQYLADLTGSGGTEMMPAIMEALASPADPNRVRIVCFMTDGEIGNDFEIIDAVKKNSGTARVFAFGIGNSVNHFLLDGIARAGRGEVEYVGCGCNEPKPPTSSTAGTGVETKLPDTGTAQDAAHRFAARIAQPVLTDISIEWGTLPVADVYPKQIPDLFSHKPIVLYGRLTGPAVGTIWLRGKTASGPFERQVNIAGNTSGNERRDALDTLWARAKVDDLMHRDLGALQRNFFPTELRDEITSVGVQYGIMTQFTSFVAIDETVVTSGTATHRVDVPVEPPNDMDADGDLTFANGDTANLGLLWSFGEYPTAGSPAAVGTKYGKSQAGPPVALPGLAAGENAKQQGDPRIITPYPDLQIGDMEDNVGVDNNFFVFTNAFDFKGVAVNAYDPTNGTVSTGDVWAVKTGDESRDKLSAAQKSLAAARTYNAAKVSSRAAQRGQAKEAADVTTITAEQKLAADLRPLLNWQNVLDADGNSSSPVTVSAYKARLRIELGLMNASTLPELKALGVEPDPTGPVETNEITATVDVRRLREILALHSIRTVKSEAGPSAGLTK